MDRADLRIFTEPQQGASYDGLLAVALRAERLGFGAFFRSDHYLKMGSVDGLPGPTDAWITLAGLARDTSTIRLGTLVTPVTFRAPGVLAISVAQVDQMSAGRVELGIGAGWYEAEHHANGLPFPDRATRFDLLEDHLAIIHGMWSTPSGESFSHDGLAVSVADSPGLPKPTNGRVPVVIGGKGARRTPALAARYADEFNVPFDSIEVFRRQCDRVSAACESIGRSTAPICSAALVLCVGEDESSFERRAAVLGREPAELREHGIAGTIDEVVERLRAWRDAGARRMYLQVLDLSDLDQLDLVAEHVAPHLAG